MEQIEADAIRRFVTDKLTLIVDNDADLSFAVIAAAQTAVLEDAGHGDNDPREMYADMLAGRGRTSREDYADVVGLAVREVIWGELPDDETFVGLLLRDLLDYGDREQWAMIGRHYLPESVDDLPQD